MTTKFKKGDAVTHLANWDSKGTVYYYHATVRSCGKVQMLLTYEDGIDTGGHHQPDGGDILKIRHYGGVTMHRLTDEEAEAACLVAGAALIASQRAHFAHCQAGGHGEGYNRSIQKDIDALHEPRAGQRDDLINAL